MKLSTPTTFMRQAQRLLLAALLHLPAAGLAAATAAAPPAPAPLQPVAGEFIVGFKPQAETLRRHALAARAVRAEASAVLQRRADALGARIQRPLRAGPAVGPHAQVVQATSAVDAASLMRQLAADPDVAYVVPNGRKRRTMAPNDPLYAEAAAGVRPLGPDSGQWYLRAPTTSVVSAINIEAAWARTLGSPSVVVAVLDTGVRFEHPDLGRVADGGVLLPGYDFVSNPTVANDGSGRDDDASDPGDWISFTDIRSGTFSDCPTASSSWHGTATASLVAARANNTVGMAGAAPGVRVVPVRVLGKCFGTDSDIQAAMLWAAGISQPGVPDNLHPARVINMSLGSSGACDAAYQNVVNQILARGVSIVAAAGNSAGGPVGVPANCNGVLGVAALRHAGSKVGFSDLGPAIAISAPGGNCINITDGSPCLYPILTATDSGNQSPVSSTWTDSFNITVGTSFASPLVAGVAALMVTQRPTLTPAELRTALQATARPFPQTGGDNGPDDPTPVTQCRAPSSNVQQLQCYCTTGLCGAGMLDAGAAVASVSGALALIEVSSSSPQVGQSLTVTGANSRGGVGATVTQFLWTLVDGGGAVIGFDGSNTAAAVQLTPSATGTFTVRLTITDAVGNTDTTTSSVNVVAAPSPVPAAPASGGGGGGATSPLWVLGVLLAVALLHTWPAPVARTRKPGTQ